MKASLCLAAALLLPPVAAAAVQSCGGEPGWASREIAGSVTHPAPYRHELGARSLALIPTDHGWRIAVLDGGGAEVAAFAAPMRPVDTNPLNIAGWHFRNRANTGPNTGNVNAPQHRRRFLFGTLARAAAAGTPGDVAEGFGGLGEVTITDLTLSPAAEGQRAVMTSLSFTACVVWQGGGDRLDPIVDADPGVAFDHVVATLRGCGLDTGTYRLSDRMAQGREGAQAPFLDPDLDGDGIPDLVVPSTRRADSAPGFAICLIGTETLVMVGYEGRIGRHLDPSYFDSADGWVIHRGPVSASPEEGPPPQLTGDAVLLGKADSSSVLIYLTRDLTVSSYWQGD